MSNLFDLCNLYKPVHTLHVYITCNTFVMCSRYLCDVLRFSVDKLLSCISCLTIGLMYMWSLPMTDCYYTILEGNFIMQSAAERFWWLEPLDNNGKG